MREDVEEIATALDMDACSKKYAHLDIMVAQAIACCTALRYPL